MAILSVQSHVAYGHVGNRSAVFPLELLGFEVWPINTVQFSNHTGYGAWTGQVFSASHIEDIWRGISDRGVVGDCEAILSGYLGDAALGESILKAVAEVKQGRPGAVYCCDPVMGDYGRGVFVREGILDFMRGRALPMADIITPNQFEAELLTGLRIRNLGEARTAAMALHGMGPAIVLLTSYKPEDAKAGEISILLSVEGQAYLVTTPELEFATLPNGAGDLTSALFLGHYLETRDPVRALELMTDSVYSVFEATKKSGRRELALVASRDSISRPGYRFPAHRLP
jgi:pyridoxine kinase